MTDGARLGAERRAHSLIFFVWHGVEAAEVEALRKNRRLLNSGPDQVSRVSFDSLTKSIST
jgi:hypothetical protein